MNNYSLQGIDPNAGVVPSVEYVDARYNTLLGFMKSNGLGSGVPAEMLTPEVHTVTPDISFTEDQLSTIAKQLLVYLMMDPAIMSLKSRATVHEVEDKIATAKQEMQFIFNEQYTRLLNSPEILAKIRTLSEVFESDEQLDGFIELLNSKVSQAVMDEHIQNGFHLTDDDRKALNILIASIRNGLFSKLDTFQEAMKDIHHASTADTLNGLTSKQIASKHLETAIFGVNNELYEVDYLLNEEINDAKINEVMHSNTSAGIYGFKPGDYGFNHLNLAIGYNLPPIIINGSASTVFNTNRAEFARVRMNNLTIGSKDSRCSIIIRDNAQFSNVYFVNCDIKFVEARNVRITTSVLNNCNFVFLPESRNIWITDNVLMKTPNIKSVNNAIIVRDNMVS